MHEKTVSSEDSMLHFCSSLERNRKEWLSVHIQLSRLKPQNRTPDQLSLAAETFDSLLTKFEARLFVVKNGDIIFCAKGAQITDVDPIVMRLRYLFSEDPMFNIGSVDSTRFCTWYNLVTEFRAFMMRITQLSKVGTINPRDERESIAETAAGEANTAEILEGADADSPYPIDHMVFREVVERLSRADISSSLRRQSICMFGKDGQPKPLFSEVFVSIGEINRSIMPNVAMAANKWLFNYMTPYLDDMVLQIVSKPNEGIFNRAFSLNLNVHSLLSSEFKKLDRKLSDQAKKTVLIELQAVDIYADMGAYVFARDMVQEKGYRVCIDSVNHLTLPYIDRRGLGADLVKLFWSPDMGDDPSGNRLKSLKEMVKRTNESRIIMARCDDQTAIDFRRMLGLNLFQGRAVDKLLGRESV